MSTGPNSICGTLEKRNAFGIWSGKWVEVSSNGQKLTIHDKEGGPAQVTFEIKNISRNDPLTLIFVNKGEELTLRAPNNDVSDDWYETVRDLLVDHRIIPHPNYGLPYEDPRNGLPFCEIPPEYFAKFKDLKKSILYWFGAVTKYGNMNALTGKPKIEERIAFLGDKAFYVTRPNSEITRCIKIERLVGLFTNLGSKDLGDKAPFLVLKLDRNGEYDLCFEAKNILPLIRALKVLYRFNSKNKASQLKVSTVPSYNDPSIDIALHRPGDFEVVTVIPSSKIELRKRLAAYYQQKGLAPPPIQKRPRKSKATPTTTERHPSQLFENKSPSAIVSTPADNNNTTNNVPHSNTNTAGGQVSGSTEDEVPNTDPLGVYLSVLGIPQYYWVLYKQQLDLDLLDCMDETDFRNFGVYDANHIKMLTEKLHDDKFMGEIQHMVEANRANANWSVKQAPRIHGGIISLSDDEDDLPPVRGNSFGQVAIQPPPPKAPIVLDDSDDDLVVGPPRPPPKMVINLSDDDDL